MDVGAYGTCRLETTSPGHGCWHDPRAPPESDVSQINRYETAASATPTSGSRSTR